MFAAFLAIERFPRGIAVLALVLLGSVLVDLIVVALAVGAVVCARAAFRVRGIAPVEREPGMTCGTSTRTPSSGPPTATRSCARWSRWRPGVLGVTTAEVAAEGRHGVDLHRWCCHDFEIEADGPVAAGIDGEAATLKAPIHFSSMVGVLSVRIAGCHPGASPSTEVPPTLWGTVAELARLAVGADGAEGRQR